MTDNKGRELIPLEAYIETEVGRWGNQIRVRRDKVECYKVVEKEQPTETKKEE
jgi:hypothetical protein